ncbi:hypothetical protein AQJ66_12075 [Streptomyces bungoensis]|uniref:Uncharacterized protein n=1 Tax=Streptomyces bungoensis TaxID=285568 RepID=A0A101T566_9ACTN|nr:hypothetical protein AQJ66_12075 [Streptomyces bungoensis]
MAGGVQTVSETAHDQPPGDREDDQVQPDADGPAQPPAAAARERVAEKAHERRTEDDQEQPDRKVHNPTPVRDRPAAVRGAGV